MQILKKNTSGITLIETMIAVFILSLTGTLIVALTLQILTITNSAKLRNQAVTFAQRGLEASRSYYQQYAWLDLSTKGNPATCYDPNGNWAVSLCADDCNDTLVSDSTFHHGYIKLTTTGSKIEVKSSVSWLDRGNCRNLNFVTYYYNY